MRNLNGRFLILVGEGSLDWGRGYYLVVTWTTVVTVLATHLIETLA